MTYVKGFSKKPQQAELIDGWLLPEVKHSFFKKEQKINVRDLKAALCFLLGTITSRKDKKQAKKRFLADNNAFVRHQIDLCVPIAEIDGNFTKGCVETINWLGKSDRKYIEYIEKLYKLSENLVKSGEEIPVIVRETEDCKRWQQEAGIMLSPEVCLINDWMHPLSESTEYVAAFDGPGMNEWMAASMICGIATGRLKDEDADNSVATCNLIKWGILEIETATIELEVAKMLDSSYLNLVSKAKEYFGSSLGQLSKDC